jgi:hypothetical protein
MLITHLAVAVAPMFNVALRSSLWEFNRILFVRMIQSSLFAFVVNSACWMAMIAAAKLFDLSSPSSSMFLYTTVICGFFLQTAFFFAGIPTKVDVQAKLSKFFRFMILKVGLPLLAIYMLILYIYAAKVIITGMLIKGLTAPLVAAVGISGTLLMLLGDPLFVESKARWMQAIPKLYHALLLPLLALFFYGLQTRIAAYGFTEFRYFLMVLGCWMTGISIYKVISPKPQIFVLPLSLLMVACMAFIGPWSAYHVSRYSQVARLTKLVTQYGISLLAPPKLPVPFQDEKSLSASIEYLMQHHGGQGLNDLFGPGAKISSSADDLVKKLGLTYRSHYESATNSQYENSNLKTKRVEFIDVENFDQIIEVDYPDSEKLWDLKRAGAQYSAIFKNQDGLILVKRDDIILATFFLDKIFAEAKKDKTGFPPRVLSSDDGKIIIYIKSLSRYTSQDKTTYQLGPVKFLVRFR